MDYGLGFSISLCIDGVDGQFQQDISQASGADLQWEMLNIICDQ